MKTMPLPRLEKVYLVSTGLAGDTTAFERILLLCEKAEASLTILKVIAPGPSRIMQFFQPLDKTSERVHTARGETNHLDYFLDIARQHKVDATTKVLHGPPTLETIRYVQREPPDLLVKAAEPSAAIRGLLLGYTDRQLLRKCPCPVWIDNPAGHLSHGRLLAAVDPAPSDEDRDIDVVRSEMNRSILQMAAFLANTEESELHVAHVWKAFLEGPLINRAGVAEHEVNCIVADVERKHEQSLADLLQPFADQVSHVHLLKGNAAEEIIQLVTTGSFDVVVMGTICRSGLAGWLLGNTAETVLNHINTSVLALKPVGSASPLQAD